MIFHPLWGNSSNRADIGFSLNMRKSSPCLAAPDPISFSMTPSSDQPDTGFLQNLVDQMRYPSFITNEFADMIVWNRGAELVVADFSRLPESERNMVALVFLDPEYPMYMERYERLRQNSEDFVRLWEWHEIRQKKLGPGPLSPSRRTGIVVHDPLRGPRQ